MTLSRLAMVTVMVCCLPICAMGGDERGGQGQPPQRRGAPGRWRPGMDESEWEKVRAFFEKMSPNRWEAFSNLPKEQQDRLRPLLAMRYQGVQWLEREGHKTLVELKEKQIRNEDRVFKLRQEILAVGANSPQAEGLKEQLKQAAREAVQLRTAERAERIKGMEAFLEKEKSALEKDKSQEDKLAETEYQSELSAGQPGIVPEPPRRGQGGPGGPGGGGPPGDDKHRREERK